MTKGTPYALFLADSTRALLQEEPDDLVYVAELDVRGKSEKVKVWSLFGLAAADVEAAIVEPQLIPQTA